MTSRNIDLIPKSFFKQCSSLRELAIFTLPDINSSNEINTWKSILLCRLYRIYRRNKKDLELSIYSCDLIYKDEVKELKKINTENITDFILNYLLNDKIILIIINNYKYKYGYIIIPGEKI